MQTLMKNRASVLWSGMGQAQAGSEYGAPRQMGAHDVSNSCTIPLGVGVRVNLTAAQTPRQLFTDEIADAFAASEISLTAAEGVCRCPVVGPGPKGEKE